MAPPATVEFDVAVLTASPAHRLVCALATIDPAPAAIAAAVEASRHAGFSWTLACELAAHNSVLPAVVQNVARCPEFAPPVDVRTQFDLATLAARTCSATRSDDLVRVFERWTSDGVCWALMKGAALIATAYPPDSRMLNDVDVLVAPDDYVRARQALVEAGFAPATGAHTEESILAIKEQVVFAGPTRSGSAATRVDLHRQVYGPSKPYRFDSREVLNRRLAVTFGGAGAYALDETDLLLHLATQLLNDRLLVKLLRLADLRLLLSRVDADESDRRAVATESIAALALAKAAVGELFAAGERGRNLRSDVELRTSAIVGALVARGWPWADAFEAGRMPETFRTAAAAVAEHGFRPAVADWLRTANEYRKSRRMSGASALRSTLGGARMATSGLAAFATLRWELRGADR
jgi:hypothetical protein